MSDPTLLADGEILTALLTKTGPFMAGFIYLGSLFLTKWFSLKEKKLAHEVEIQKLKTEREKLAWEDTKKEVAEINKKLVALELEFNVIESQVITGLVKRVNQGGADT